MNVFRRRRAGASRDESPVESALRRSLASHAFETPDAGELTRRILDAAEDEPERLRHGDAPARGHVRTWGLPLVAAACVAAVVGVGAVVASLDRGDGHHTDAASRVPTATSTSPQRPHESASGTPRSSATYGVGTSGLTNVKIIDLTFFHTDSGIALASAHCITGPGRCTALLQTTDGTTWYPKGGAFGFDVHGVKAGCPAARCVDHIRFANDQDGYAFGPDALFVTTDGGNHWAKQPGGAAALETLGGNVIRVRPDGVGAGQCLPGCEYDVQVAGLGDPNWKTVALPGPTVPAEGGVQLSRGGASQDDAYLLITQNPAGGAPARSTLYRSSDAGRTWHAAGEPCPQLGGSETDSYEVSAGGVGDDVSVLCRVRSGSSPFRVATSTDGGRHFAVQAGTIAATDVPAGGRTFYTDTAGALAGLFAGEPATVLAVAGRGVFVSTDGGKTFHSSPDLVGGFGLVGFESTTVGRAVTADGRQIWTTRNAGRSWRESTP